jgi:hypothetical protein
MPKFTYIADRAYYVKRPVPNVPGSHEYLFYSRGVDLPENVPSGCNPRHQNPDQRIYRQVAESYRNKGDLTFHTKNKGITTLVESVEENMVGGKVHLVAEIPAELGNVDGEHTNQIIQRHKRDNPDQLVHVTLKEGYPTWIISPVAAGLNTGMQVTSATMADHYGLFAEVQEVLHDKPYAKWIGYRQNETNISATSKDLVSLMWCCNPCFFQADSQKHPGWVYNQSPRVYDRFYNTTDLSPDKDKEFRAMMLQMVKILPDIIELYCYINETVTKYLKKVHKSRVRHPDGHGEKTNEINVGDLCVTAGIRPFRDPTDKAKVRQLRDSYRLIITSGLRGLVEVGPKGFLVWRKHLNVAVVKELLDKALPGIYKEFVLQLRTNKRDHNLTSRQPAIWDVSNSKISLIYYQEYVGGLDNPFYQGLPQPKRRRANGSASAT